MNQTVLSIQNMSKSYQNKKILNHLNWDVQQGDIIALLGKNGAGKSTLLETIMNLRGFDEGELMLWGQSWSQLSSDKRQKIAFVAQETTGFEWMSVKDFLNYLGHFFPQWDRQYCKELRDRWNLDPQQKVGDLSGGQTQILHVIQAISTQPDLLILDEPVAHLDPNMRRGFISELVNLACEFNTTVVFSSHIISDLERVANKVALLRNGQITCQYDVDHLKESIAHIKIAADKPIDQSDYFAALSHWHHFEKGATAKIIQPLEQGLENFILNAPYPIDYTPMSLEDWYLEVSNASH